MDLNCILVVLVIGYMSLASPEASGSKYNERNPENHIGYGLASPEASGSKYILNFTQRLRVESSLS